MKLKYFTQPTPNPNAVKFILNMDVITSGRISYSSADECHDNKLASSLFAIEAVKQIHFFENVITVTQDGELYWEELEDAIISLLEDGIEAHDPEFEHGPDEAERRASLSPEIQKIEEILDRTVRPSLQGDGGDLLVLGFDLESKILKVAYEGACNSCASSTTGTLMAIKSTLKAEFDPEIEVAVIGEEL